MLLHVVGSKVTLRHEVMGEFAQRADRIDLVDKVELQVG